MTLLPFKRPTVGLCIRAHSLSLVELQRDWRTGWRTQRVRRVAERAVPAGVIRPSSTDLNVTDSTKLVDEIQILLDRSGPTMGFIGLPDACARTMLFEFDALPVKPAECLALIRFRFQKDLNVPAEASRLAYHVFRLGTTKSPGGPARVLATALRSQIIEQYEQVCEKAGLIPATMGLTSLSLFDLCQPLMAQALIDGKTDEARPDELFFSVVSDEGFSLFAIRDGAPVFLRMKSRNGNGQNSLLVPRASLTDELVATLQFYDESVGRAPSPQRSRPLFIVGNGAKSVLDRATAHRLGIEVQPLTWDDFPSWRANHSEPPPASTLGAIAGLFAA